MANSQTFTLNIKAVADMKDVVSNIQGIQSALGKLKLPDGLKNSFKTNFKDLEKELDKYQRLMSGDIKTKGDANALTKSGNNILRLYDDIVKKINSIDDSTLKKAFSDLGAREVENLRNQLTGLESDLKSKLSNQKFINFDNAKTQLKQFKTELSNLSGDAANAFKTLSNSTFNTFLKNLDTGRLDLAAQNLAKIKQQADQIGNTKLTAWVEQLRNSFESLQNDSGIKGTAQAIEQLKQQLASSEANVITKLITQFHDGTISAENFQTELNQIINSTNQWGQAQAQTNKELDQVRSRIQYFFGLNNAINLVKRAVRGAYETIKELDKAMTETAVVTDFSVGDMWKQLPEYTKRANELGVTTKAAYEAATLYYQQGLSTEEVNALSVETLKMARIAGLDAAEATDRMTNALRGFNMELNEINAQRVDDVYSKLAAISASDVDEISTAMTKVASLAHNAGMEFETTAAFLAQIIETTRESAETAGTALKTVVARFTEVKKLVNEGELKGQDEEGELIDVNKVSAALRTAGIDLNKYFLGEVGIDDIFMELAEKWDSLTSLQQRYIATQAAGSRQQSRFIALMSDYARTQELVGAAYNANGAAAEQFGKTQESLESKLARLKNAWNEFLMGLTNNTVVKAGVDALTTLLNIVNKLTSAFGEGVGSVMKWAIAIATLRGVGSFVSSGGGLTKLLGTLTGGKGLAAGGIGKNLSLGIGTLGKTAWGGLGKLGALSVAGYGGIFGKAGAGLFGSQLLAGVGETASFSLAGLTTALTGVAAAAIAVGIAYKTWEKFTPQGQLKTATKIAEQMKESAKQANDVAKSYKDVQDNYKGYTDAVKEANSTTERDAAIKNQNDYILSLIEKDATYAKYLKSDTENGQITLSLNSETLAKDAEEAAKKATEEATKSYFANAEQQRADARVQRSKAESFASQAAEEEMYYGSAAEMRAKQIAAEAAEEGAKASMTAQARLGYQTMLGESDLSDNIKDLLATTLSQVYEETGQISDSQLTALTAWASSANAQKIMSLLTGDIGDTNLLGKNDEQMLEALGFDKASGALDQFADLLGLNNKQFKELKKSISNVAQSNKEIQENNRQRLAEKLNGLSPSTNYDEFFTNAAPSLQQTILNALEGAESLLTESGQKTLADILVDPGKTEDEIVAIQTFINGINFDKPINAYTRLQEGLNSTNEDIRLLAQQILDSNKDIFNSGHLIRTGLAEAYEEVGEEIDKLIEKNGEITTDDIDDLAKSSSALSRLLKLGVGNASTFAKALTLVGQGKVNFDDLNDSLLNVLDNAQTFGSIISDIHNLIANFDEGIDYGEGVDFLVDKIKELNELTENFEFGNQRTEKLWNLFFGQDYKQAWAQGEDYIRGRITQMQGWLDNDAYGFFSDTGIMSALGISSSGDHKLDWDLSKYANYDALLNDIARVGGNLSTDAAKILLTQFASHGDLDFATQLEDLSYKSITGAIQKSYKTGNGKTILTNADIQAIADSYGLSFQKVSDYLKTHLDNYINIDEQGISGENLYQYFIKQLGGEFDPKQFINDLFPDNKKIDLTQLRSHLASMGYTDPNQQADLANSILRAAGINDDQVELNELQLKIANVLVEPVGSPVVEAITKALENAAKGLNITVADINLLLNQLSPGTAANLMQAIAQLIQADPSNYLVLQSLTATINDLNLPPEQAAAILTDLATQLTSGEPINLNQLKVTLTDLGLTQEQVNSVIDTLQGYIDSSGNLTLPEIDISKLKKSEEEARGILAQLWEDFKESENYVPNRLAESSQDVYLVGEDNVDKASIESAVQSGISDGTAQGMEQGKVTITTNIDSAAQASALQSIVQGYLEKAGVNGAAAIQQDINTGTYTIVVDWTWKNGPPSVGTGATGGIVRSSASGSRSLNAGISLTGEEGEEIVWNKERGYAYVTGSNGPEFRQLNPGDRVFNANETARILARSFARGGIYYSLASGRWNPNKDSGGSGSGSGGSGSSGSSSSDDDKGTEWKNEIDWIYNLMEDIEELERKQTKLQEDYEDYLQDDAKNGRDLYNLLVEQLGNLYTQLNHQQAVLELREREMREFMDTTNQFDNLLWYNWDDRTLEIDWDQIEAIQDKDTYDKVSDLVSEAESIQKKMDDADDSIMDIKNQIQELENIWRDTYVDFESRVFDAVVSYYQDIIDNYSELHDTLSNSNSAILSAIQKQIALERQIRDNTQTEENIADTEAQLAFLRRDTTGGNELASLQLQKELSDQRQSYEDTLIDQAISRLQDDNEAAAEQRQKQIEIMQAQLDYQQQSGEFNAYVRELLETAMGAEGELLTNSDLMTLLKDQENWSAMSDVSKQVWEEELNTTFKEVAAFILKQHAEENGTFISALTGAIQGMTSAIGSRSQPAIKIDYSAGSGGGGGGGGGSYSGSSSGGGLPVAKQTTTETFYLPTSATNAILKAGTSSHIGTYNSSTGSWTRTKYATGGLNTETGFAWLDGTADEPEYVLNARQTDAFLRLADILPTMMEKNNVTNDNSSNQINLNLVMNVDQIASDYDVDRIADRVKDIVYNAGQYRNVNTLNFIR